MLKKLRIGTIVILVLSIFLLYVTENFNFLIPMMIMVFINTMLDVYITIKKKRYKTYKWIAITDLIVGVAWMWIAVIVFLVVKELYNLIGNNYFKYTFISCLVSFIASMFRNYLKSERFKFSDSINDKNI
ncbi:hypothetical protein GCM10008905_29630 [Clostridium malenominatum]|uniref:Uncharacterized protein n=1 Tax=Clostridium malenominatum TaxID=1539 RepID=A0ABP3UDW0_9CLOT